MARNTKPSFIPTPWHAAMWLLLSACVVMLVAVWYSGSYEASDALEKGRRMVVNLSTGEFQGMNTGGPKSTPGGEQAAIGTSDEGAVAATVGLEPINKELLDQSEYGLLPTIGPDGTKPWRYYSRAFQHRGGLPMVAIIVGGLGQQNDVLESALHLPVDMTLSFSPYAKDVGDLVKAARAAGHETMMDLPLEPNDYPATDPGPYALLTGQAAEDNTKNLQKLMGLGQGYVGFLMPYSESYSEHSAALKLLLQLVNNHGLMMVVAREPHKTETRELIDESNTPAVVADVWVDEDLSEASIADRLATLEQIAKKRGYAIGIAHGLPITIEQLRLWSAQAANKGFVLVPVTFIAKPRFS